MSQRNVNRRVITHKDLDLELDNYWDASPNSKELVPQIYKNLNDNIYRFMINGLENKNDRSLSDLLSLRNIAQIPKFDNLGLDAKQALMEIINIELDYLNGKIILAVADEKIKNLSIRVSENRNLVTDIVINTSIAATPVLTAASIVFTLHWNNFQSIITAMSDVFRRESFNIAGLPGIIDSISKRTDIYYFLQSPNSFSNFITNIIYPSQANAVQQAQLLRDFAITQNLKLIEDESTEGIYAWTVNTLSNSVKSGVNLVKYVVDKSSGGQTQRVEKQFTDNINYIYSTIDSAYNYLTYFTGLLLILFIFVVIYKCYKYKTIDKEIQKSIAKYDHSFEFGKSKRKNFKFSKRPTRKYKMTDQEHEDLMNDLYGDSPVKVKSNRQNDARKQELQRQYNNVKKMQEEIQRSKQAREMEKRANVIKFLADRGDTENLNRIMPRVPK
jgi:hypothetical protein